MIPPHWQSILTKKTSDPSPSPTPAINDDWLLILLCFFFKFFSDKAWARDILCLRVKCKQSATGCGWIGQLRHAEVSGLFLNWHIVLYFLVLFIPLVSFFSLDKTFPVEDESSPGKPHKNLGLFLTECRKTNV